MATVRSVLIVVLLGLASLWAACVFVLRSHPAAAPGMFSQTRSAEQYVPDELAALLVCITHKWNVSTNSAILSTLLQMRWAESANNRAANSGHNLAQVAKLSHLHVMLLTAQTYQSPTLDIVIVTDNASALRTVLAAFPYPINITVHEGQQGLDSNTYWLAWVHRDVIQEAVSRKNYTTVLYMEVNAAGSGDAQGHSQPTHDPRKWTGMVLQHATPPPTHTHTCVLGFRQGMYRLIR